MDNDLAAIRKATKALGNVKVSGKGPTLYWDAEDNEIKPIPESETRA